MKKQNQSFKAFYLFIFLLFIIGFIYGNIMYNRYGDLLNHQYVKQQILHTNFKDKVGFSYLIRNFAGELISLYLIWFLAFTIVGSIFIFFINFFLGFIYGFTFRYFVMQYSYRGFYIAFLYTFPKNILLVPFMIYLSAHSIVYVLNVLKTIYLNYNKQHLKSVVNQYLNLLMLTLGVLIIYTLMDAIFYQVIGERLRTLL